LRHERYFAQIRAANSETEIKMDAADMRQGQSSSAVLIGRFQPFHLGHAWLLAQALQGGRQAIVLIGSAGMARSVKNPFTVAEREAMVLADLSPVQRARVCCYGLPDCGDDAQWVQAVRAQVRAAESAGAADGEQGGGFTAEDRPAQPPVLLGHFKDESSYYLRLFPEWTLQSVQSFRHINATDIRAQYFAAPACGQADFAALPPGTLAFLKAFAQSADYRALAQAAQHAQALKKPRI